ncbi:MAG: DUF5916 domain-containing protein [Ignavibacteriales bacterium]|nr:DUF5916 domain-containing protein [Ignavibacteriales bacterium]
MMNRSLCFPICFLLILCGSLVAGSNPKKATAVRTPVAPRIDGVLDEPEWKLAKPVKDFLQQDPDEGAPGTMPTEFRILYDDEAIYFGCTMDDPDPSKIIARLVRRDDEVLSDNISIRIDTYHDHQTNFEFTINAAGVKIDILQYNDGQLEDASWDAVWEVKTRITGRGWIAEVRIPFRILRFQHRESFEWGLQLYRRIARLNELQMWALRSKSEGGHTSKFGHLVGIEHIPSTSNVEIIPYAVADARFVPKSPSYPDGHEIKPNAGFDFKYRPASGFTVDATVNPDFGQVEADPAVLNLTTFETFYPEKRPFFVEGSQIMQFTTFGGDFGPGLFYSRRIGRALDVEAPGGGYVLNKPRFATILGAAKISGKTARGLSVGVLEVVTRKERATLVSASGGRTETVVEPLANYSLVRLRQDVLENSNIGMIVTSVNRDGVLPAMTAGADWSLKFDESMYRVDGFLAGSRTTIPEVGRANGTAGKFNFSKDGGPHWRGFASFDFTSKKYNINDMGYFRRPNDYGWMGQVLYRDDEVTESRRFWSLSSMYHLRRNFDGAELNHSVSLESQLTLPSYWMFEARAEIDRGKYDDREMRGYGLYRKPGTQTVALAVESDKRQHIVGHGAFSLGSDQRAGRYFQIMGELELKPATNISLEMELQRGLREHEFAWVAHLTGPPDGTIFAERSADEWSLMTRGSYVFSTELTLQVYFQLFFATGTFENFQQVFGDDRHFAPYTWSLPSRDFNDLSFNSNVVLRWEYLPGSTVYLVWSQSRQGERGSYRSTFGDNLSNTFALPSDNVLLLKISYWLSM